MKHFNWDGEVFTIRLDLLKKQLIFKKIMERFYHVLINNNKSWDRRFRRNKLLKQGQQADIGNIVVCVI